MRPIYNHHVWAHVHRQYVAVEYYGEVHVPRIFILPAMQLAANFSLLMTVNESCLPFVWIRHGQGNSQTVLDY